MDQVSHIVTVPSLVSNDSPRDGQVVFLKDTCITNIKKKIVSGDILSVVYTVSLKTLPTFPSICSCDMVVSVRDGVADCDTVDSEGRPIPLSMFYEGSEIMGSFVFRGEKLCVLVLCLVTSSPRTQRALMLGAIRALYVAKKSENEP